MKILKWLSALVSASFRSQYTGGPLNIAVFNDKFVAANQELAKGDTNGLHAGLSLLIESLEVSGDYVQSLVPAIEHLYSALSHHDRADTKGPWNRDLSGYGVISWSNDLYDRDSALQKAWPYIQKINDDLKSRSLGWHY